jgi:hypothetical protein
MLINNKELLSCKSNAMQLTVGSTYSKQILEFLNKDHWD